MIPQTSLVYTDDAVASDQWRQYGENRRRQLIQDEQSTVFEIHSRHRIQKYFDLVEKISRQFLHMCKDPEQNVEETYVMGHRLVRFITTSLPQHPEYSSKRISSKRSRASQTLMWIQGRMDELALKIDEEQLNKYILHDFEPDDNSSAASSVPEDDDDDEKLVHSNNSDNNNKPDDYVQSWEPFDDWHFDVRNEAPKGCDTDISYSSEETTGSLDSYSTKEHPLFPTNFNAPSLFEKPLKAETLEVSNTLSTLSSSGTNSVVTPSSSEETPEPDLENDQEEDYISDEDIDQHIRFEFGESESESSASLRSQSYDQTESFLQKIADESVQYETDSEAVDSWAQDGTASAMSGISFETGVSYDPARIAFRDIVNSLPRGDDKTSKNTQRKQTITAPPPPPPTNSPSTPMAKSIAMSIARSRAKQAAAAAEKAVTKKADTTDTINTTKDTITTESESNSSRYESNRDLYKKMRSRYDAALRYKRNVKGAV